MVTPTKMLHFGGVLGTQFPPAGRIHLRKTNKHLVSIRKHEGAPT